MNFVIGLGALLIASTWFLIDWKRKKRINVDFYERREDGTDEM